MHITRFTDYSLRILLYMAAKDGKLSTIQEMANAYEISKNHLMKIVQDLNSRGYVHAVRGKNGGVTLNKSPAEINVGKLVNELEGKSNLLECFGPDNKCVIANSCRLKKPFAQAVNAFYKALEEYTLQDILSVTDIDDMCQVLNIAS